MLINGSVTSSADRSIFAAPLPDQTPVAEVDDEEELPVEEDEVLQLNADAEAALGVALDDERR